MKRINLETKSVRLYPGVSSITTIQEKDSGRCGLVPEWGSICLTRQSGVYSILTCLLNLSIYAHYTKEKTEFCILVPVEPDFLFMTSNKKNFIHQYRSDNCALISDNIYTILPRQDGSLLMGTENWHNDLFT